MQGSNSSIHSDFNVKNICIPKVTAAKLIVCTIHNSKIEGLLLLTSKKIWNPFFNDNVEISTEIQYTHLHNKYHCVTVYMNTYIIQERFVLFENYVFYSWFVLTTASGFCSTFYLMYLITTVDLFPSCHILARNSIKYIDQMTWIYIALWKG